MRADSSTAADRGGFLSEAEAIEKEPLPWQARATLYVLVALLVVAATWATLAQIDRIVVGRPPQRVPRRSVTTAANPFRAPGARSSRTPEASPHDRAAFDPGIQSESETVRRCPRSRPFPR